MRRAALPLLLLPLLAPPASAQSETVPLTRFVGTWVGTQSWDMAEPPPGARTDQPVALTIELVDGTLVGRLTPFLGGEDGASFASATVAGDELQATGAMGPPPTGPGTAAGRRAGPRGWKEAVTITFGFTAADALNLVGTADVRMGDVSWMKFRYKLSKQRSRY
jgi:hypothetical protein